MISNVVANTLDAWWDAAAAAVRDGIPPDRFLWRSSAGETSLFDVAPRVERTPRAAIASNLFVKLAKSVACHRDDAKWDALYAVLWRMNSGESELLSVITDPAVYRLVQMHRNVKRSAHKMKAFVRFRRVDAIDGAAYVAWFEPAHLVVERTAPFFARRFTSMRWSILTPDRCAHWDLTKLSFTDGVGRSAAPTDDSLEDLWRTYYANVFNPARLNGRAMRAEMPRRYWSNLPEARIIADLKSDAPGRVRAMLEQLDSEPERIPADLQAVVALEVPGWDLVHDPGVGTARERETASQRKRSLVAVAPRDDAGVAVAPRDDAGVAVAPRDDAGVAVAPRDDAGVAVAPRDDAGVAVAPRDDAGVAVAPRDDAGVIGRASLEVIPSEARDRFPYRDLPHNSIAYGVAGWTDPTLLARGVFYPDDCTTAESRLRYYATKFSMVEVDATYYSLPSRSSAAAWAARTPDDFTFDIKAHALMTGHPTDVRRLPDWVRRALPKGSTEAPIYSSDAPTEVLDEVWSRFRSALDPIRSAGKLGAIMLQFPRWFEPTRQSAAALRRAKQLLGDDIATVEFRNRAWMEGRIADRTLGLLRDLELSYVIVDGPQGMQSSMPPTVAITDSRLAVFRLHGRRVSTWEAKNDPVTERYRYLYDRAELRAWIPSVLETAFNVARVHMTFNNNHANYATTNALEMEELMTSAP